MNSYEYNIGISSDCPIYFSHINDIPRMNKHDFHLHDFKEFIVYVEGDVDFIIDKNYISLKRGDVILANENILHKVLIKSPARYDRYYIGIPTTAFAYMDRSVSPIACFDRGGCVISLDESDLHTVLSLLRRMDDLLEQGFNRNAYTMYGCLLQILSILNKKSEDALSPRRDLPHELVSHVLDYLEQSATQVNSVAEIAEHFHVSASYLSALFSQDMEVTLKRYLMICKISQSKIMLSRGESVSNTGLACGFCSTSHFISVFREITGTTPNGYRRRSYI